MKKIFFLISLLSFSFLTACTPAENSGDISLPPENSEQTPLEQNLSNEEIKEIKTQEAIQNKIENIRKRLALKGLIIDGDGYYREGQIALALVKYLEFYRKNPEDQLILEKLGDAYYNLHKFSSSYVYYSKIQNPNEAILDKIALSLIQDTDFTDINAIKKTQNILHTEFPQGELQYYYLTSLDCALDFHTCKLDLNEYFWPTENQETSETQGELTFQKLIDLKQAIENYRNFQVDQVYLKDAYIVASWYSKELYALSAHMGNKILSYKPGYKPILKIVSQSYFELGAYDKARASLTKYQDIDDTDPAVNYMLGIINTQLQDYVLANIHLSKAIKLGSKESLEIRRQLIHNFYQLDNQSNILREFKELIAQEENYTSEDLGLAIYNHILEGDNETALKWAIQGQQKFPEQAGNFYAYEAWIYRETGELQQAENKLLEGMKNFPDNPFILINLGYTALELEKKGAAIAYFKKVLINHPDTEFAVSAQNEIDIISES